ncbi:MAG TPA: BMC domain-containing protein [Candidatus Anaerobutyricum stercoripullorum]|uniref:BMC domain-containing protein n=1 Tax=Candidatus Anaerobutyricum stercoripullorum TaxID=2838456 RepID=A0A9D1X3J9_9FIRM|nr:BMC domain-containing protein [Candidatus Anaerobutyricum stercoripullorum]
MGKKCIGLIEAHGLAAAIQAADTAVKSSKVQLLGYEYSGHSGMIVVKIEGTAAAVKSAMDAAAIAVGNIPGSFSTINATVEKAALDESVYNTLIRNKQTVGDPLQIASGKRPQGTGRQAKWVGHWEQKGAYIRE